MGKAKGIGIFLFLCSVGFGILTIITGNLSASWRIIRTQFQRLDKFPPILLVGVGGLLIGLITGYFSHSEERKPYWKT